jgi:molybdenum cofactor sulfurtransferase
MEAFLKEFGDYYGYPDGPKNIQEIRDTEFKRLDKGVVYLDHAGSTLYSELQMEYIFKDFTSNVFGNPHSQSDISSATSDLIADARHQVLEYFNASPEDYSCLFTSGATAALKLVGETFPWTQDSNFLYTMENHNSVLGIREYALAQGASACAVDIEEAANQPGQLTNSGPSIKEMPIIYLLSPRSAIFLA